MASPERRDAAMMSLLRSIELRVGAGVAIGVALLFLLLPGPFHEIEKSVLKAKYAARGQRQADSSIVLMYLDNADIAALGDLPVKRSYYALLIHALRDVGAATIGIDIGMIEPDAEHPEYDRLLSTIVKISGNVVFGGYFRELQADSLGLAWDPGDSVLDRFSLGAPGALPVRWGAGIERPFPELLSSAAGFGHTNFTDNNSIPLLVRMPGERYFPSFGYALMLGRLRAGAPPPEHLGLPGAANGDILLNYPGDLSSFRCISVVDFLKGYDDLTAGRAPSFPVRELKGKTVIVGIVAEGRSTFIETPFTQHFPSIGMHAAFIDNVLRDALLRRSTPARDALLALVVGLCSALLMMTRRETLGILGVFLLLAAFITATFIAFSLMSHLLAVVPSVMSAFTVTLTLLWYKHRAAKSRVDEVVRQQESIVEVLREKEAALAKLEREVALSEHRHSDLRSSQLHDEIRQYKAEVDRLKALAADLRPSPSAERAPVRDREEYNGILYRPAGPMGAVVAFMKKIADSNATVLILGESGTGKELVAQAVHRQSQRREKPFVAVNCGALAETLLESELFGYERGAFTGAVKEKPGRFELADGGTIFLDEIGEISEAFQVKLLRVLQDGTFERVGGTGMRRVDVRIIAATNRDLKSAVAQKQFREDLYYRLNVFSMLLPPLRERGEDLRMLIEHFAEQERAGLRCSESVMDILLRHPWRGNIRELQSVMKRAALLARADGRAVIQGKDLAPEMTLSSAGSGDLEEQIIKLMREKEFSRNAVSETADDLGGLNRGTVAEYVRGLVFKTFAESMWSISGTVEIIAGTRDTTIRARVEKKVTEYLANATQYVDSSRSFDEVQTLSKPKYKNLPQRYHRYLDEVISSSHKRLWSIEDDWTEETPL